MPVNNSFGLIVVGDEILNARRQDRHFDGIGALLRSRGFQLAWLRILPDDPEYLVAELARTMGEDIPVFCCGGIGATPDDHTRRCASLAANVEQVRHAGAVNEIEARFGEEAYPTRIQMADLPFGSELIPNPYNRVPGFSINKHYFMPGFPDMAHPMAEWVLDTYYPSVKPELTRSLRVMGVTETVLMPLMERLVDDYPEAKFFSLPRLGEQGYVELGFRSVDDPKVAFEDLQSALKAANFKFEVNEVG